MEGLFVLTFLVFLIFEGITGMRMGRHMTFLFRELKEQDPELWRDLAQPNTGSMLDVAGSLRGHQILAKGDDRLASHPKLSDRYHRARKAFFLFQIGGIVFFVFLFAVMLSNAL